MGKRMKGMMKKTAILLAAALICFLAYAGKVYANPGDEGITDDGIKYQVNGDGVTVTLTGFEAPEGFKQGQVLELPDKVNGLTVTDIGDEAFKDGSDKYKWTGVVFPKDLKTIGAGAFRYDGYLSGTLVIPNSVTSIGNEAFYYCDGLSGLVLSNSLQTIGNSAFYSCTGFTGELKLPTTLTVIGELAFFECSGFTGALKLPRGLVEIKYRAFEGCIGFTGDLVIPNTVTTIGVSAFSGIFMKDGLIVPASVTSIGNGAFYNNYFRACGTLTGTI